MYICIYWYNMHIRVNLCHITRMYCECIFRCSQRVWDWVIVILHSNGLVLAAAEGLLIVTGVDACIWAIFCPFDDNIIIINISWISELFITHAPSPHRTQTRRDGYNVYNRKGYCIQNIQRGKKTKHIHAKHANTNIKQMLNEFNK